MRATVIIQARMSSQRLPGKVLHPICGKPVLAYVLERVARCRGIDEVVVATSDRLEDQEIVAFCRRQGVQCRTGPLDDVAGRFAQVVAGGAADCFVRICADSPLIDPRLIESVLKLFRKRAPDLATNVHPRSFPSGQSVEVVDVRRFLEVNRGLNDPDDREHVTMYFYRHAEHFDIVNLFSEVDLRDFHLAVDEPCDLLRLQSIVSRMHPPHWRYGLAQILRLYPGLKETN